MKRTWLTSVLPVGVAVVLAVGLLSCVPERDPEVVAGAGDAAAWIDAPVSGATVEPGTVEVLAHATAPAGVVEVVLADGGSEVGAVGTDGGVLVTATFTWEAVEPGLHVLTVRGRNADGALGPPGSATVHVAGDPAAPTTTTTATTSTTAGDTTTSTTTPATTTTASTLVISPTTAVVPPPLTPPTPPGPPGPVPPPAPTTTAGACTPPTDLLPKRGATVDFAVTRSWTYDEVCEPVGFRVETSQSPTFPAARTDVDFADADWRELKTIEPCGTWYWRIAAILSADTEELGPWSATSAFVVAGRGC